MTTTATKTNSNNRRAKRLLAATVAVASLALTPTALANGPHPYGGGGIHPFAGSGQHPKGLVRAERPNVAFDLYVLHNELLAPHIGMGAGWVPSPHIGMGAYALGAELEVR